MMDVTLKPFAVNVMLAGIGAIGYNNSVKIKQQNQIQQLSLQQENIKQQEETLNLITESLIDKRFRTSKQFLKTHDTNTDLTFKKSLTSQEKAMYKTLKKQLQKSKLHYNKQTNSYNQHITTKNAKTSVKYILKKVT